MKFNLDFVFIFILFFVFVCSRNLNYKLKLGGDSSHKPILRPLRRSIKNYIGGQTATITIVYQRSYQRSFTPKVRWFKQSPSLLPHAEIANMINIDGDQRYSVRSISSHDITSIILTIHPVENKFPATFVTCFSIEEIPFQYQLDTIIDDNTENKTEYLDGIIWRKNPPSTITFTPLGQLSVTCAVTMESISPKRFTDQLHIYRSYLDRKDAAALQFNNNQLMSIGCGKIYNDKENYTEASGKYTYSGNRSSKNSTGRDKTTMSLYYDVSFQVLNGSQDDIGVYTCAGERIRDRTYISSWVRLVELQRPAFIFVACDESTLNRSAIIRGENINRVKLTSNVIACVRCRAYDYLTTRINLRKDGEIVQSSTSTTILDWHLNVADGGLSELTITFLQPNTQDVGVYECFVKNDSGGDKVKFAVSLK